MAIVNLTGNAQFVTQVDTLTITGTPAVNDVISVTCNGKVISFTATTIVVADLIAGLIAAFNSNTGAEAPAIEFTEVTAAQATSTTITFTSLNPGEPFTFTYAGTGAISASAGTTTTAATGPWHADNVKNYDIGALPSNNDTLVIPIGSSLRYALTALAGITLGFRIFTDKQIGLPVLAGTQQGTYQEYRGRNLQIKNGASLETLISCSSNLINLDGQALQQTLRVNATGGVREDGAPAVNFIGTSASNVINLARGSLSTAFNSGELATVATFNISYIDQQEADSTLIVGYGTTWTTLNMVGGTVTTYVQGTTINKYGGTLTLIAGTPTTINHYAGTIDYRAGNCTTYKAYPNTINNFFAGPSTKTFTNTTIYELAEWQDPMATIIHTNTVSVPGGVPNNIKGTFGPGRTSGLGNLITFGA